MKSLLFVILLCFVSTHMSAQPLTLDYAKYDNVFIENFDYPDPNNNYPSNEFRKTTGTIPVSQSGTTAGHPIRDFWDLQNGDWGAGNEHYIESNVTMQSYGVIRLWEQAVTPSYMLNGRRIDYHAGFMKLTPDYDDYSRNYGYGIVEASIRFPDLITQGDSSTSPVAFWLQGMRSPVEIDIFDNSFRNWYLTRLIDYSYNPTDVKNQDLSPNISGSGFHTFSAEWTPSVVRFYIDGIFLKAAAYNEVRSRADFYNLQFAIMPGYEANAHQYSKSWQFLEMDWVKIWRPRCEENDLAITQPNSFSPFNKQFPSNGRLFKHPHVSVSSSSLLTVPHPDLPTIIEAEATTITSNFLADQSTLQTTSVPILDNNGNILYYQTQITNGFLEIIPIQCGSYDGPWHKQGSGEDLPNSDMRKNNYGIGSDFNPGKTSAVNIYPNPNGGDFTLQFAGVSNYDVCIRNAIGISVYSERVTNESKRVIHLDERLPTGNYIIQIKGKDINHTERISIIR